MKIYMIKSPTGNLFSTGGTEPKFKPNGKIWAGIGAVKNHLHQGIERQYLAGHSKFYLNPSFNHYLDCYLIIFDTETMTAEVDEDFVGKFFIKTIETKNQIEKDFTLLQQKNQV